MTKPPDDMYIEGALRAAWGEDSRVGTSEASVLARLDRQGVAARVLLSDDPNELTPILRIGGGAGGAPPVPGERYHLAGEIATGGVGVVYKARDVDLGRDVALKALRADRMENPEIFERFFEEAQIGAQLQHPGIVPVYGLGLMQDGRPFFAMKLVKGRTLAAHLQDRTTPQDDQRRLLEVFEDTCQTVAYAHARKVIHRDLKPSNVMVGAFGEVLVVDWGFGKVLGQKDRAAGALREQHERTLIATVRSEGDTSQSLAGSVMGTPAYMPPEQAMGQVDALDARSDVFGLGAILCHVLTGEPPYAGEPKEILRMAMQARLEDAHARLDACGAAPPLVALCRRCLAPARSDRPKDGSVLAQEVASFLAAAEERAHAAELTALQRRAERDREARAAEHAVRARKRTRTLAAALVGAFVLGVGLWLWQGAASRARADDARPAVETAMAEASALAGRGRPAEALRAAEKARELAQTRGADDALRARAADLVAAMEAAGERARQVADDAAARDRFEAEVDLAMVRLQREGRDDPASVDRALGKAFQGLGLDLDRLDVDEAAAWVAAHHADAATLMATRLTGMAASRRHEPALADRDASSLLALAQRIDPDPWRTRLRECLRTRAPEGLDALAGEARTHALSASSVHALAVALWRSGRRADALAVLHRGRILHPDSYPIQRDAARFLAHEEALLDAMEPATAAVVLSPESVGARGTFADVLSRLGRHDLARHHARACTVLRPQDANAWLTLGVVDHHAGHLDEAERSYAKALQLQPDDWMVYGSLADVCFRQGRQDEAIALVGEGLGVHAACGGAMSATEPLHLALSQMFEAGGRLDEAIAAAREGARVAPNSPLPWSRLGKLLLGQRAYEEAAAALREAVRLGDGRGSAFDLALALYGLDRLDEADEACREAIRFDPANTKAYCTLGAHLASAGQDRAALEVTRPALRHPLTADRILAIGNAAGYATKLGFGVVADAEGLSDAARRALRAEARDGLAFGVADAVALLEPAARRAQFEQWLAAEDLAPARDPARLAALTEAERADWQWVWDKLRAALSDAEEGR